MDNTARTPELLQDRAAEAGTLLPMLDPQILAFTFLALLLTMTPGADTLVLFRNVLRGGRFSGFTTALGGRLGLVVHAALSAAGLSAVLAHSATAYQILKWAGAAYLVLLGSKSLLGALRPPRDPEPEPTSALSRSPFLEGFLTNVLNPKTAVFYLAFLPQFITPSDPVFARSLLLCGIHIFVSLLWYGLLCLLFVEARKVLARPPVRRFLDGVSGTFLAALGLRLAFSESELSGLG